MNNKTVMPLSKKDGSFVGIGIEVKELKEMHIKEVTLTIFTQDPENNLVVNLNFDDLEALKDLVTYSSKIANKLAFDLEEGRKKGWYLKNGAFHYNPMGRS